MARRSIIVSNVEGKAFANTKYVDQDVKNAAEARSAYMVAYVIIAQTVLERVFVNTENNDISAKYAM